MKTDNPESPEWIYRGKSIRGLIQELQTFEDLDLEVKISIDDGNTRKPISLVVRSDGQCLLKFCGD
ncbi:hypothetical protein [Caballeronia sp. dw_19]|uniref:hypothetical protein n=1 Tax=Caballeronia sp. dw_19 TaxID=2719791 RepID=UPI001BD6DFA6|nr:hypothetical protein [Caballeronia sp. dw_19]